MNPSKTGSRSLYDEALKVLPGGISRNTIYRKPHPDYVSHGEGCRVTDIDGHTRIDFANNMASLMHGHAHPKSLRRLRNSYIAVRRSRWQRKQNYDSRSIFAVATLDSKKSVL